MVRRITTSLFTLALLVAAIEGAQAIPPDPTEPPETILDLVAQDTPAGFYMIPVRGGRGLHEQLIDIATVATAQELTAIVELSADWCSSCLALDQHLALPQTEIELDGVLLVELNVDLFSDAELESVGMNAMSIPMAYGLGPDGRASTGPIMVGGDTYEEAIESFRVMLPVVVVDPVEHPWN